MTILQKGRFRGQCFLSIFLVGDECMVFSDFFNSSCGTGGVLSIGGWILQGVVLSQHSRKKMAEIIGEMSVWVWAERWGPRIKAFLKRCFLISPFSDSSHFWNVQSTRHASLRRAGHNEGFKTPQRSRSQGSISIQADLSFIA